MTRYGKVFSSILKFSHQNPKKRTSTYFIKCHNFLQNLKRAKIEDRLESRLKHYTKYKLLIIMKLDIYQLIWRMQNYFSKSLICVMKNVVRF